MTEQTQNTPVTTEGPLTHRRRLHPHLSGGAFTGLLQPTASAWPPRSRMKAADPILRSTSVPTAVSLGGWLRHTAMAFSVSNPRHSNTTLVVDVKPFCRCN